MHEYRFLVRRDDESIEESQVHHLRDDVSALEHARTLLDGRVIEGWQQARFVFRLLPDGTAGT
jgi:hypothetical protein